MANADGAHWTSVVSHAAEAALGRWQSTENTGRYRHLLLEFTLQLRARKMTRGGQALAR